MCCAKRLDFGYLHKSLTKNMMTNPRVQRSLVISVSLVNFCFLPSLACMVSPCYARFELRLSKITLRFPETCKYADIVSWKLELGSSSMQKKKKKKIGCRNLFFVFTLY